MTTHRTAWPFVSPIGTLSLESSDWRTSGPKVRIYFKYLISLLEKPYISDVYNFAMIMSTCLWSGGSIKYLMSD